MRDWWCSITQRMRMACEWMTSRCETTPKKAKNEQPSMNQRERSRVNEPRSSAPSSCAALPDLRFSHGGNSLSSPCFVTRSQ